MGNLLGPQEYFGTDESLGVEGVTVFFKPKRKDHYKKRFYAILSTEKKQDGRVVYFVVTFC